MLLALLGMMLAEPVQALGNREQTVFDRAFS